MDGTNGQGEVHGNIGKMLVLLYMVELSGYSKRDRGKGAEDDRERGERERETERKKREKQR